MSFIIHTKEGKYFCGWNQLGEMVFRNERHMAYRMRKPVAITTLDKVSKLYPCDLQTCD